VFVNEQTLALEDRLTLKLSWIYYHKIRGEEMPVGSRLSTPPSYVRFVKRLVAAGDYDVFWLNFPRFARLATKVRRPGLTTILDVHDLHSCSRGSLKPRETSGINLGLKFDFATSLRREIQLFDRFNWIIVNSLAERQLLLSAGFPARKIVWLPHFSPNSDAEATPAAYESRTFEHDLLYVGSSYRPNIEAVQFFLQECFPAVLARRPGLTLSVVGAVCNDVTVPPALAGNVRLLGFVPELAAVYARSRVFICPLLSGAGTKLKLSEAMSHGLPIVTTSVGASGMPLEDGESALVADGSEHFTTAVLRITQDPALAGRLAAEAARVYREHYSRESIYQRIDEMLGL
jgi:polysaccharide biosynthesis protein PslH